MPLVSNRKFGISYLHQPYFCQQLGLFGKQELLPFFLDEVKNKFRFADINLHSGTIEIPGVFSQRKTYWLNLNDSYAELSKKYNADARKNLHRLGKKYGNMRMERTSEFGNIIQSYKKHLITKSIGASNTGPTSKIKTIHYQHFEKAIEEAYGRNLAEAYYLRSEENHLLAAGIFLKSRNHYHYLTGVAMESRSGLHGLIDGFIKLKSGSEAILDFEGSEIAEIATFFEKFGAEPVPYFHWKWNNLPPIIRFLKK